MIKTNLPVILLRGLILLPNNEIRLEFDNDLSRNIIDVSEMFHDNMLLVVNQIDPLEESPNAEDLPSVGVVSKITNKIELPNGKTRVIIKGINRAKINEFLNLNKVSEVLESIVTNISEKEIDEKIERVMVNKIYRELEMYVKRVPYISNSILSLISNVTDLSRVVDMVAPNLLVDSDRLMEYLYEVDVVRRGEMILEDIYKEEEMFDIEKEIDLKVKRSIDENQKEFLLREKMKLIKEELGDTTLKEDEVDELKDRIENIIAPKKIKERLTKELKRYDTLPSSSPELSILRNYIDTLLSLPWGKYTTDNDDINSILDKLNEKHYGLSKVKQRIIEYLAVKLASSDINSPIICLVGPPGVGKTSLSRSIAEALDRKFVKISVGGLNDENEIKGHRKTYLGAMPGRIIQSMKKAKSCNPVFLIDEIDKMTKDYKGDPASALLEVLDPEQNKYYSDNYIEEEYDLSKVMFIVTANDINGIPGPLRDRLEIIELNSYTEYEKLSIAKEHLIPKLLKSHGNKKIIFKEEAIADIIRHYTKEAGVRDLERKLEEIIRKIVTNMVINKSDSEVIVSDVKEYLGNKRYNYNSNIKSEVGVVNGLAYTVFGGDLIKIEVNFYKGTGKLVLTGSLGEVMKESATTALSYIKGNADKFGIDYNIFNENDIHIHVPEGAIPKDGPSAGVTITTAIISALTNKEINNKIAMTGEITLRGNVLPIGGLKEKSIGAIRSGVENVFIPSKNISDLDEIDNEIKNKLNYIPVDNYFELYSKLD